MFSKSIPGSLGFQEPGTYTHGIQAQPGTVRKQTLVYSSYGKLLVHSMIYYVIIRIYAATWVVSMQLAQYALDLLTSCLLSLNGHICIINFQPYKT